MEVGKKYQVFVSSTFRDLVDERREVMQALLELDCIPSGMELFPAANEDQWTLIKGVIDDCDYYLVVIAGRYGSMGPDGLSYTEMEYRYAVDSGKPVIGFLHGSPEKIAMDYSEKDEDGRNRLAAFRDLVQKRTCKYWTDAHELGSVVSRSLISLTRKHPSVGWVRGDQINDTAAKMEILKLRQRIDELQGALARAEHAPPPGTELLAQGNDEVILDLTFSTDGPPDQDGFRNTWNWNDDVTISWDDLFYVLSPQMISPATLGVISRRYTKLLRERMVSKFESKSEAKRFKGHTLQEGTIVPERDNLETVILQFDALGLIAQAAPPRGTKEAGPFWTLTPFGRNSMSRLRAILREDVDLI